MQHVRNRREGVALLFVMPIQIDQDELASLQMLRNQVEAIKRELHRVGETVFARLERGVEVEAGAHRAWIEEHRNGTKIVRVLVLNGNQLED